ncbi:MAG: L,D-transpeptidase [Bacteroidetes bacterium]|nr:L,D-transpeptidase [Bacteroidota bacterium]
MMEKKEKMIRSAIYIISVLCALMIFGIGTLYLVPNMEYRLFNMRMSNMHTSPQEASIPEKGFDLKKEVSVLKTKLEKLSPGRQYLVINSTDNTFKMFKNNKLVREGICSTGSYIELDVGDEKTYKFETPKGVFTIKGKIVDPVWKKPDWAFAEEGLPIPPPNHDSRFEYGVLGDYALNLGDGYLIHGTLYQRFLGMAVTHGCVRLSDGDLKFIYKEMPVGAKVFIY